MAHIDIYTTMFCGYCTRAKKLLTERGAAFTEIDVMTDADRRAEMLQRAGGRTSVPQIFIDDRHVGGYEELYALDRSGELRTLLQGTNS